MRYFHKLRNKFFCPKINIEKLWSLLTQEDNDKASKDNAPLIDVTQFGYFKVLGKGVLPPNQPLVVKAKLIYKIAEKKIKESGGAVVLTAYETESERSTNTTEELGICLHCFEWKLCNQKLAAACF